MPEPARTDPHTPTTTEHAPRTALVRAVRAVSGVTLLSRFGGLARDVLIARLFSGDAAIGSAFAAAFQIPNMFRRLFGEGALSAAFIPEYTAAQRDDDARPADRAATDPAGLRGRLATITLCVLGIVTSGLVLVLEAALLVVLLAFTHDRERALSIQLIMVMLPFMPLICGVAILGGMLQAHGRFAASSSGPVLLNGFMIAVAGWCLWRGHGGTPEVAFLLAGATVLSGLTQFAWFARLLRPHVRWSRDISPVRGRAAAMLRRFIPVMIGLGTLQLNAFADTVIAMWPIWFGPTILGLAYPLDEASNLLLSSTVRLYQFPLGVFGVAVATAALPMLARHASDPDRFIDTLRQAVRLSLFIGLPASAGLLLVRHDLTAVLFGYGASGWNAEYLGRSAAALAGYAVAIWAYSLNHVLTRAFYARGDTRTPLTVSLWMAGINLTLNLALIWPLREAGLAWSTAACALAQCAVLTLRLHGTLPGQTGATPLIDAPTLAGIARLLTATAAMAVATGGVLLLWTSPTTWLGHSLRCGATVLVGSAVFAGTAAALRLPELGWLVRGRGGPVSAGDHGVRTGSVQKEQND